MSGKTPQAWFLEAQKTAQSGDRAAAMTVLEKGMVEHPREAGLRHAAGKMLLESGDPAGAAEWFGKAFAMDPGKTSVAIDQAIALGTAGLHEEALAVLRAIEKSAASNVPYCSTRGFSERGAGNLAAAAQWYDRALALEPRRARALQGRATVALERGESDAVERFDRALTVDRSDPHVWFSKAQALDVDGRTQDAREIIEMLVAKFPQWPDALKFLAQLRLAAGEKDFAAHYADAAARVPDDPNILSEWAFQLYGLDFRTEAADIIARARRDFPEVERFALLEAIYACSAGQDERAESLFAGLSVDSEERWMHEGRHAMQTGQFDRAERALERALEHNSFSISTWALRGNLWRLTKDPRAEWLHGQDGLVRMLPLRDADKVLPPAIEVLANLHDGSAMPLGQSLRGGTQTRGILFDRTEPQLTALRRAIDATLQDYRAGLPDADETHPLLRHRDREWSVTNSWSVRLSGGGDYHVAHVHPQGVISSALYCALPQSIAEDSIANANNQAGWIELGRPPPDHQIDLEPLHALQPKVGHLALFPSTMYHGTKSFSHGTRMTVAFDVVTSKDLST